MTKAGDEGFHWGSVAGIPGLKSETWGTLRFHPSTFGEGTSFVTLQAERSAVNFGGAIGREI
jgi:hypothetical protein